MIGQTISHYKILEKLGEGGMGVVYKAEDTTLRRTVALKFLPQHVSASETDKARFLLEAQAAAALNHPNICTIYGIEEHNGQTFIAMEFVDGQTLREKRGTINLGKAIDIGIQIAEGLAIAHEKGIVHRDIKPENIMVRKDGIVQIMDFGLAKLRASRASRLTKEGSTVGTAGYMSPEQVQGQETDHRSDIFSLGVLLYELFSGELPFKGVHETAVLYEIVNVDPAPMSASKPEIDPELDRVVLECLQKEPDERYQGVKDISKDLKRFKRESSRQRATRTMVTRQFQKPGMTERHSEIQARSLWIRLLWPMVSVILGVAVVVLAWSPWRNEVVTNQAIMCFPINLPLTAPLLQGASTVAISPDGRYIVFLALESGNQKLFLRPLDQFTSKPIPGTEGANDPFFSPDGQWIAFWTNGKLKKASIYGGAPQDICDISYMRGGWWTSDNFIWYGHINSSVYRVPASGGTPQEVTILDTANGEISHRFPQLLPDGKTVIFTVKQNNISTFDEAIIAAENISTHERKVLIHGGSYARYLPSGHLMYARGTSIYAVPFDIDKIEANGPPLPVVEGGMLNQLSGDANFCFTNTGTLVYVPIGLRNRGDLTLVLVDRHGSVQPLLETPRPYDEVSLSPDGQKLAMTIRAANDDIWVYQIARGTLTRLTFGGGNSGRPAWMPDGKSIVYVSERRKAISLFRKPWDGSGVEEQLGDETKTDVSARPSFTPDGKIMAYSRLGDIWIMSLDNDRKSKSFIQSSSFENGAAFSPDGHWMSYISNESGRNELYVVPFPKRDGKWQVSTNGALAGGWSRSGKELLYTDGKTVMKVDVKFEPTFDFSSPQKVCDLPSSSFGVYDVTPDGKRFVVGLTRAREVTATQVNVVVGWFDELKKKFSQNSK